MPSPHFSMSIISSDGKTTVAAAAYQSGQTITQKGQSVVATAAYLSGETLYDARNEKTFDYRYRRNEDLIHSEIIAPDDAPAWAHNRSQLWNQVQARERGKHFRLARTIIAGLPRELDHAQNLALVRGFAQENFTSKRLVVDFAIHESKAEDGGKNPHVHIMVTVRGVNQAGFLKAKERSLDKKSTLQSWRNSWEQHTNRQLELADRPERVSLKSYEAQGKDKTPQVHLGVEMGMLEKKGIETKRGDYNRKVRHENAVTEILSLENDGFDREADDQNPALAELQEPEKGQMRRAFRSADQKPAAGNQKTEAGISGKEGVLGTFRKENKDTEDLAVASLEASRALNEAAIQAYLQSISQQTANGQLLEKVRLAEYARLTTEKPKDASQEVSRQLDQPSRQAGQMRKEREDDLER